MNRHSVKGYFLTAAAILMCFMLVFGKVDARAEAYSYTVTFYPGNHGSFRGTELVEVDNSASGSAYVVSRDGSAIRVSGLCAGDVVGFDAAMEGAVELEGESRYYVKGIRVSGRDNSTVDASAFRVEEDRDYVVAYGIRGDLTSYVVNYRDEAGNTLADSRTYYGNVGDKPRIAYRYIEGYQPQAYNLTKTLSKNTAENVFTFIYTRVPTGQTGGTTGGDIPGTGGGTAPTVPAGTTPGQGGNVQNPDAGQGTAQNPGGQNPGGQNPDGQNQGGQNPGGIQNPDDGTQTPDGGDTQNPDGTPNDGQGDTQNPDENNGPREEVDLDDQETPLANYGGDNKDGASSEKHFPIWASIGIAVAGVAAVAAAVCVILAGRKKAKTRTGGDKEK